MLQALFFLSLTGSLLLWAVLVQWYGLIPNYEAVHFAFDKVPGHLQSTQLQLTALMLLALPFLYAFQYWYLKRLPHFSLRVLWIVSVALYSCIVGSSLLYPAGALDVYYYAANLKLYFFYGANPYITGFIAYPQDSFYQFMIAPQQLFPYGPVFLLFSGLPLIFTGVQDIQAVVIGLKLLNVTLLLAIAYLLYRYHKERQVGLLAVFFFVANPLVLFEALGNAHNDLMLTFFLVLAVVSLNKQSVLSGVWFMASMLIKVFTIALAPLLLYQMKLQLGIKKTLLSLFGAFLVAVISILPFWENGAMLTGTLEGMTSTRTFHNISLYSLVKEYLRFQPELLPYLVFVQPVFVLLFLGISIRIIFLVRGGTSFISGLIQTYLWFLLLVSIFYQWYLLPVLALIAFNPTRKHLLLGFVITAFGLFDYMLSVFFWFDLRLEPHLNHFIRSFFLTVPILLYLMNELRSGASKKS